MHKRFFLTLIMALICKLVAAQFNNKLDSLEAAYKKNRKDSILVEVLIDKGVRYRGINPDSGMLCLKRAPALARKMNYKGAEIGAPDVIAPYYYDSGNLAQSMKMAFEMLPEAQAINEQVIIKVTNQIKKINGEAS